MSLQHCMDLTQSVETRHCDQPWRQGKTGSGSPATVRPAQLRSCTARVYQPLGSAHIQEAPLLRNGSGTGSCPLKVMGTFDAFRVKAKPTSLSHSTEVPQIQAKPIPHSTLWKRSDTAFSFAPEHGPHAMPGGIAGSLQFHSL